MGSRPVNTVAHDPSVRFIYPARLTAAQKQVLWAKIKINNPGLVGWFADPLVKDLQSTFGAEVFLIEGVDDGSKTKA